MRSSQKGPRTGSGAAPAWTTQDWPTRRAWCAKDWLPTRARHRTGWRRSAALAGVRSRRWRGRLRAPAVCASAPGTVRVAAACLDRAAPGALDHAVAGHVSAEAAHGRLLGHLGKEPLLSLGMRLGEGSGAALAIGVLKGAIATHSGMATFAEAGVSDG